MKAEGQRGRFSGLAESAGQGRVSDGKWKESAAGESARAEKVPALTAFDCSLVYGVVPRVHSGS